MFGAMGVLRNYSEELGGHPIATCRVITGDKPMPLRAVFEHCKGRDYNDC